MTILLSAILSACQNNEKEVLEFQRTYEMKCEVIVPGDSLMTNVVQDLFVDDKYIYICAESEGFYMQVRERNTGKLLCRTARIGQGPGEVFMLMDLHYNEAKATLEVFEPAQQVIIGYKMNQLTLQLEEVERRYVKDVNAPFNDVYYVSEGKWLLKNSYDLDNPSFVLYDGKQVTSSYIGFPTDIDPEIDVRIHASGTLSVSPDGKKLVTGITHGATLETFSIDDQIRRLSHHELITPIYEWSYPVLYVTNETIIGFIDVKSTNEKIYALLSGHRQNVMEQEGICIFDWNGTPLEKYHTDAYLTRIALTPEGDGSFYGVAFSEEDGYSVVRMEID